MGANWTAIEDALRGWVKTACGLPDSKVIWGWPNAGRPTGTFVTLELLGSNTDGNVEITQADVDPEDAAPGADLEISAEQLLDCGLRVQCYAPPERNGKPGVPFGPSAACAVLSKVRASLSLPSIVSALDAAGVSVEDDAAVQYVPEITGTDFEGRAVLDVRFFVVDSASERTTYIERVQVTDERGTEDPSDDVTFEASTLD